MFVCSLTKGSCTYEYVLLVSIKYSVQHTLYFTICEPLTNMPVDARLSLTDEEN